MDILQIAKDVFISESQEIARLETLLTDDFVKAVNAIFKTKGKCIVTGVGKSGLIGKKIAATLASTGTPSFFLHPSEAYHGDLGMIEQDDIVLLISNSGETDEVLKIIPYLKFNHITMIAMTGNPCSTLAKNSDFHLNISVSKEACPLQLAPTTSATATLVMGDALAIALMKLKNFKETDFAQFHPGGNLGKKLLATVESLMKKTNLPVCGLDCDVGSIVHKISVGKCGLIAVEEQNKIVGIITDGDIRRAMEKNQQNFFALRSKDIMSLNPKKIAKNTKLSTASEIMNTAKISSLLVVDDNEKLIGIIQNYDIGF